MTTAYSRPPFWLRCTVGIVLLWSVIFASYYYFYKVEASVVPSPFYHSFPSTPGTITHDEMISTLKGEDTGAYNKMVVDSVFLRYKLDPTPGGIFEQYMDKLQHGLWSIPPTSAWVTALKDVQARWSLARQEQEKQRAAMDKPAIKAGNNGAVRLEFNAVPTARLGSTIALVVELPSEEPLAHPVQVSFQTDSADTEPRLVAWSPETKSLDGKLLGLIVLDFSTNLRWLAPEARLNSITLNSQAVQQWKIREMRKR